MSGLLLFYTIHPGQSLLQYLASMFCFCRKKKSKEPCTTVLTFLKSHTFVDFILLCFRPWVVLHHIHHINRLYTTICMNMKRTSSKHLRTMQAKYLTAVNCTTDFIKADVNLFAYHSVHFNNILFSECDHN